MIHAPSRYAKTVRIIAPFAAICGLCYLFLVTFLPARFDPAATLSLRNRDPKQAPNSGIDRILVGGIQEQIQTASASSESSEINEGTIYDHDLLSGAHRDIIFEEYSFGYVTDRGSFDDNKEANNLNLPKGSDETDEEIKSKGNSQSTQDNQYEKEYHDGLDDLDDGYSSNSALEGVSQDLPLINQEISEDEQVIYEVEKANGVILMLTDEDQFQDTRETIRQVEDRFNRGRNYPWVILSPFPLTDRSQRLAKQLSKGNMRFGVIPHEQWRLPKWIDAARVRNNDYAKLKQGMNKTSLITRHRWRYMSGFVAEHELLDPYEFFWRVEPGVEMFCNIDEDPMLALKKSGQQFAWSLSSTVNEAGISSGLNIIQNFKKLHQDLITPSNDENFLVKGSKDGLMDGSEDKLLSVLKAVHVIQN
ncbi:alpha 1,2-mannosyltransferase 2.4.1 [Entomortierella beljakovae]|nr:alpha 1,2-mannosyltransferase 2.4.1 [Entomortierella beljakovae]